MKKFDFKKIAMKAAGVSGGAAVGVVSNKFLGRFDPKIRGGAKILAGAILPEFAPKSSFVSDMGAGVIAVGATELLESFAPGLASSPAPVSGIYGDEEYVTDSEYTLSGIDDDNAIAGDTDNVIGEIGGDDESDDDEF
jgi:hypothetical protein